MVCMLLPQKIRPNVKQELLSLMKGFVFCVCVGSPKSMLLDALLRGVLSVCLISGLSA